MRFKSLSGDQEEGDEVQKMRYLQDRLANWMEMDIGTVGVRPSVYFPLCGCICSLNLVAAWKTPSTCPQAVAALAESSREEVKAVERFMIVVSLTQVMHSMDLNGDFFQVN